MFWCVFQIIYVLQLFEKMFFIKNKQFYVLGSLDTFSIYTFNTCDMTDVTLGSTEAPVNNVIFLFFEA